MVMKASGLDVRRIANADFPVSPVFVVNQKAFQSVRPHLNPITCNYETFPKYIYIINQVGSRSGKTYSILQVIIIYVLTNTGKIVDVVRKTHAELADTVVQDFIDIVEMLGLTGVIKRNKTKHTFKVNGNTIRFMGMDKAQKKSGSKRDLLYINEANGLTLEDWIQLNIRASGQVFIDYNPSEHFWVNEQILEKENKDDNAHILFQSTYLDNYEFLSYSQIKKIEALIDIDDFWYQVYTLGNLAVMKGKIYKRQVLIEPELYDSLDYDELYYGLDFGYEHNMCLIECKYSQEKYYERERYCKSQQQIEDLIKWMDEHDVSMTAPIYCDSAYPAMIRKLKDAGYNARRAKKDVNDGIRLVQGLTPYICKSSVNLIRSRNKYKWRQTSSGEIVEGVPVKVDDDPCDAERYAQYSHWKQTYEAA
jgi:phage terminase large subunit